jgi:hypothetical protein
VFKNNFFLIMAIFVWLVFFINEYLDVFNNKFFNNSFGIILTSILLFLWFLMGKFKDNISRKRKIVFILLILYILISNIIKFFILE